MPWRRTSQSRSGGVCPDDRPRRLERPSRPIPRSPDPPIPRSPDPPIPRSPDPPIPDDLERIIKSEIRKELRGFEQEQQLPFGLTTGDGGRRVTQSAHDPSKPTLCERLDAVAHQGLRVAAFQTMIRRACAILVDARPFRGRRRGRRWTLDPGWLFRRAYVEDAGCGAIAGETDHPARCVVEILRRLANRLERRLLVTLALPPDLVATIVARAPVGERDRERVLDALQAFVAGKET
jgi:hypothetical protein